MTVDASATAEDGPKVYRVTMLVYDSPPRIKWPIYINVEDGPIITFHVIPPLG